MSDLTFRLQDQTLRAPRGTPGLDFLTPLNFPMPPVALLLNHKLNSLRRRLDSSGTVEPVFLDGSMGHKIYRRSVCFLFEMASRRAAGDLEFLIGPSFGDGYYITHPSGQPMDPQVIKKILDTMKALVEENLPILPVLLAYHEVLELFPEGERDESRQLVLQKNEAVIPCIHCGDFWDLEHNPLVPETGVLQVFDLVPYRSGAFLHFPAKAWPLVLRPREEKPILLKASAESQKWASILGVSTVPQLNQRAQAKDVAEFIQVCEALQDKQLSQMADLIGAHRDTLKVVLVAGPSSSGKTTFTKKLAIQLRVLGFTPRLIGLDDYFVDRDATPKNPDGTFDFECLEALDVGTLNQNLVDLLARKEVELPVFDFKTGTRKPQGHKMKMEARDILLMEGIHGLNDRLTPLIPRDKKFKIYISALTGLSLDNHTRISTTDHRLLRRMVRDYQFRGYSALHTLKQWPSVRRGEDKNIFPYQETADAMFNSSLDYEIPVLKSLAEPLLKTVPPTEPEYARAHLLLRFLENFTPISAIHVPSFSLVREFIGQSGFKY